MQNFGFSWGGRGGSWWLCSFCIFRSCGSTRRPWKIWWTGLLHLGKNRMKNIIWSSQPLFKQDWRVCARILNPGDSGSVKYNTYKSSETDNKYWTPKIVMDLRGSSHMVWCFLGVFFLKRAKRKWRTMFTLVSVFYSFIHCYKTNIFFHTRFVQRVVGPLKVVVQKKVCRW